MQSLYRNVPAAGAWSGAEKVWRRTAQPAKLTDSDSPGSSAQCRPALVFAICQPRTTAAKRANAAPFRLLMSGSGSIFIM